MDFSPTNTSRPLVRPVNLVSLTVVNVLTVVVGQPVMARMLWVTATSSQSIDVLNMNLGIYYAAYHWMCTTHLLLLYLLPVLQEIVLSFMFAFGQTGGPLNLAFISLERYVAVIYPTSYHKLKQYKFREMCAAAVWFFSFTFAFISIFLKSPLEYYGKGLVDSLPVVWMAALMMLVVHCSFSIGRALRKSRAGSSKMNPGKKKAFHTVVATLHIVLLCYGTMTVLSRLQLYMDKEMIQLKVLPLSLAFLSAASVAHPLYHLYSQGRLFDCLQHRGPGA